MAQNDQTQGNQPQGNQPQVSDGIQGEGNYDAARRYRKEQETFARSGKVDKAAHEAEEALDGPDGAELERARRESGQVGEGRKPS
jgi:hypothetical protein